MPARECNLTSDLCNPLESSAVSVQLQIEATRGPARAGKLITPHGVVETPVFMPVGTLGSVKGVSQDLLEDLGVEILLGNTYHLYLRPGVETVRKMGGLHRFMSWDRAILTDSGGFQVFSLTELRKVSEELETLLAGVVSAAPSAAESRRVVAPHVRA